MNIATNSPATKKESSGVGFKRRKTSVRMLSAPSPVVYRLSMDEESFLSGITTSGQFTIQKSIGMYSGVRLLRDMK